MGKNDSFSSPGGPGEENKRRHGLPGTVKLWHPDVREI